MSLACEDNKETADDGKTEPQGEGIEGSNLLPGWDKEVIQYAVEQDFSLRREAVEKVPSIIRDQLGDGKELKTVSWDDGNGNNFFGIFWEEKKADNKVELSAYHAADMGGKNFKVLRKLIDFVEDCEFDRILDYIPGSLTVTDLDSNRYGEVTFLYQMGCVSDVSPLDAKLMLLENGEKYAIRGTTTIKMNGGVIGGKQKASQNFSEAHDALRTYAEAQWDRFTDTTVYYWQ